MDNIYIYAFADNLITFCGNCGKEAKVNVNDFFRLCKEQI